MINSYKNMCTKDKCLAKSPKEQQIVAISAEMEKIKETNPEFGKIPQSQRETKGKDQQAS